MTLAPLSLSSPPRALAPRRYLRLSRLRRERPFRAQKWAKGNEFLGGDRDPLPRVKDAMCGFRLYPLRETLAIANRKRLSERMTFDIEILVRLAWRASPFNSCR
jgi:hypothetical protein